MLQQERRERDDLVEIMSLEMEGLYGRLAVSHMWGSGRHHTYGEWRLFVRNGSFFMKKIVHCNNKDLLKNLGSNVQW
jgi:hypothetical protein